MFANKYPNLHHYINSIKNNDECIKNIKLITENTNNIIFVNDYEVTCKISQYYLNPDTPLSRNSNVWYIRTYYASYIYYTIIAILVGGNSIQCYTFGEFIISSEIMIELINELEIMFDYISDHIYYKDSLELFKTIMIELIMNDFDESKYEYLITKRSNQEDINENLSCFREHDKDTNNRLETIENEEDSFSLEKNINTHIYDDFENNIKDNRVNTVEEN